MVLTGITQKVIIVSDNCMIAWAGQAVVARTAIRELKELASRELLNFQSLDQFLQSFRCSEHGDSVQFIGCLIDDSKAIYFSLGGSRFDIQKWGEVRSAGTGSEDLHSVLTRFELPQVFDASETNPQYAILRALMITGHLLQVELTTHSPLLQYYGGGYEIATLVDGKFQKIGNIVYLFWDINVTNEGVGLSYPYHVVKIEYLKDILVMRAVRIDPNQRFQDMGYIVSPVSRQLTQGELSDLRPPDMNGSYFGNLFLVKWPDGSSEWMSRVDYIPTPSKYIVFHETADGIQITVDNSFLEIISQQVVLRSKNRTPS